MPSLPNKVLPIPGTTVLTVMLASAVDLIPHVIVFTHQHRASVFSTQAMQYSLGDSGNVK